MDKYVLQFQAGVDDYYRGYLPARWDDEEHRKVCPYHFAWHHASEVDNGLLDDMECDENA